VLVTLAGMLVHFTPDFEILPGTVVERGLGSDDAFVQEPLGDTTGG